MGAIMDMARGLGYHHANRDLTHSYIQILCFAGNFERAKNYVIDLALDAEENGERAPISANTFALLAADQVMAGDLGGIKEMSSLCRAVGYKSGLPPHIESQI